MKWKLQDVIEYINEFRSLRDIYEITGRPLSEIFYEIEKMK